MGTTNNAPEKDLLIVDSGPLKLLSNRVSKQFSLTPDVITDPPRRYIDALPLLGRHDVDVLIPSVVAFKSGGILDDGRSPVSYMPERARKWHKTGDLADKSDAPCRPFLREVIAGKYRGVAVVPPGDDVVSESANFVRNLKNLMDNSKSAACAAGIEPLLLRHNLELSGRRAARDIVVALPPRFSKTVFYLTDSIQAVRQVREKRPDLKICAISTKAYLDALHDSGALETLGMQMHPSKVAPLIDRLGMDYKGGFPSGDGDCAAKFADLNPASEGLDKAFVDRLRQAKSVAPETPAVPAASMPKELDAPQTPRDGVDAGTELVTEQDEAHDRRMRDLSAARRERFRMRRPGDSPKDQMGL